MLAFKKFHNYNFKIKSLQNILHKTYSSNFKPINMAHNVFESPSTDKNLTPLIVMHGLLGLRKNWRGISLALEKKTNRMVITVDARNHGESPHSPEHSSGHMAEDVKELMRTKNIARANVMGHSMGGLAMMCFALRNPDLVERAIIVDVSPIRIPNLNMDEILLAMKNVSIPSNLSMAEGRLEGAKQMQEAVNDRATIDFIMMNLGKRPSGEFYWAANVDGLLSNYGGMMPNFKDQTANLAPFTGPVMFICGSESSFVDPSSWPEIQEIFPNSEIKWLETGHLVHLEKPAEFIELTSNFLKQS